MRASSGYIESRQEQGVSYYNTGRYAARYASLTARIPADKLESVLGEAGTLCNLVNRETGISDVTESYTDTEARLATLRLQEERLLEILSKATTLTDVLELESRLSDVRYQIERYEANLRNLDSRISYSTLHLNLQEVVEYSVVTNPPQTLAERLSEGLSDTFRSRFIYDHLKALCQSKLPIKRYYHWCFNDNFEWLEGNYARFGIVYTNFDTQERIVKPSGEFYSAVIAQRGVTEEMYQQYVAEQSYHF